MTKAPHGLIEYRDRRVERIEDGGLESLRLLCRRRPPALGDISCDSAVALELVSSVEDRLAGEAEVPYFSRTVPVRDFQVSECDAPLQLLTVRAPIALAHIVDRQIPERPPDDALFGQSAGVFGGASVRQEAVALIELPIPVKRESDQAAESRFLLDQRPLCGGQQNGVAVVGVDDGIYLTRFDGQTLGATLDQAQDCLFLKSRSASVPDGTGSGSGTTGSMGTTPLSQAREVLRSDRSGSIHAPGSSDAYPAI